MKRLLALTIVAVVLSLGDAYSKYGRTCQDIGCTSNQVCVMKQDPCTAYSREGSCGMYPSCEKVSNAASTCATFVCPPTQICKMDRGQPKCFDDPAAAGTRENKRPVQSYNPGSPGGDQPSAPVFPSNNNYPQNPNYNQNNNPYNPSYNPGVYPNLPSGGLAPGHTTPRPNVYQPGQHASGGGYQGGQIGSGYPGSQGAGYPRQGSGYPSQSGGYPGQAYPGQQYPSGQQYPGQRYPGQQYPGQQYPGHSTQGGGYPKQGSGGYPKQGQYNPYGKSGQESSNPLLDRITGSLKTLGLFWFLVKYVMSRAYGICS